MNKDGSFGSRFLFVRYHHGMDYQAKLSAPFGMLGIRCTADTLTGIDFLPAGEKPLRATSAFAQTVCEQLLRYLENPDAQFSVSHRTPPRSIDRHDATVAATSHNAALP